MVAIHVKVEISSHRVHEGFKQRGRNFERCSTMRTQQVSVDWSGEVVDGRRSTKVSVDDDAELFELLEIAINRRRTGFGSVHLHRRGQSFCRDVISRLDEGLDQRAFRRRDASTRRAQGGENVFHPPRLFTHELSLRLNSISFGALDSGSDHVGWPDTVRHETHK